MNAAPPLTFLLVSGAKRSGTTALAESLNTHPEIGILQEYGPNRLLDDVEVFFRRWREQFGGDGRPEGIDEEFDEATFPLPHASRDFEALLKAVYTAVFPGKSLRVFGDKTPLFVNDPAFERLPQRLPGTRVIYVLRNPIDTTLSSVHRTELAARGVDVWDVHGVWQACREWIDDARSAERLLLSQRWPTLVVKYEDLAGDHAGAAWSSIADFLGVANRFVPVLRQRVRRRPARAWCDLVEQCFEGFDEAWASEPADALLARIRHLELPLTVGQVVSFEAGFEGKSYVRFGFSDPESGGSWTVGTRAEIAFRVAGVTKETALQLDFSARLREGGPLRIGVEVNGDYRRYTLSPIRWDEAFRVEVPLPPERLGPNGQVRVLFDIFEPKTPDEQPAGDTRAIGLFVRRLRLTGGTLLASTNLLAEPAHARAPSGPLA